MAMLDELFTRYGYPADEMNEKIWFCFRRAGHIANGGKEDAQSLINFYDFAESGTTVFDEDENIVKNKPITKIKMTRPIMTRKKIPVFFSILEISETNFISSQPQFEQTNSFFISNHLIKKKRYAKSVPLPKRTPFVCCYTKYL